MNERRHDHTLLRGSIVELRAIDDGDVDELLELWAASGDAAQERWPTFSRRELDEMLDEKGSGGWRIEVGGELAGFIQHYQELGPDYRHAGVDVFLTDRAQDRGVGTDAVRTLCRHLVHDLGHHRLIIDPAADNARAIRCYEKVGFRPVGTMREYERGRDGSFHDSLLMDCLARELT